MVLLSVWQNINDQICITLLQKCTGFVSIITANECCDKSENLGIITKNKLYFISIKYLNVKELGVLGSYNYNCYDYKYKHLFHSVNICLLHGR